MLRTSLIVPILNNKTTILQTLDSLFSQEKQPDELIFIDDFSKDGSLSLVSSYLNNIGKKFISIKHHKSIGLARTYNEGIRVAKNELVVLLHADILLKKDAFRLITDPFFQENNENIVATYHVVDHPFGIWKKYNFWQKCYFARFVDKKYRVLGGKFNCYRKSTLFDVGLFDASKYRTAGEDGDMLYKLKHKGKCVFTNAEIIHVHKLDPRFSYKDIVYKHAQYAEAQGALLRNGIIKKFSDMILIFYREILITIIFIPYIQVIGIILIIIYSFMYTKLVYLKESRNPRIILLPLLNTFLLVISLFFCIKGYVMKKQSIC